MNSNKTTPRQLISILVLMLILCAVWSIPHTIGIRYTVALVLIFFMLWIKPNISPFLKVQPTFLILILYIFIHIFLISDNLALSIRSFNQEWLKFIIFTILGGTLGLYFSNQYNKDFFLWLGGAFSIPLLIHLFLFILRSTEENLLPYGYAGLSISHGDLGYTALQSSIFLSLYVFSKNSHLFKKLFGFALLFVCFLSPYLAQSRGGLIFVIFSTLTIASFFYLNYQNSNNLLKIFTIIFLLVFTSIFSIKITSVALQSKWQAIGDRIEIGLIGNPISIMCNGTGDIYEELKSKSVIITPHIEEIISDVNLGTAARVTVARAGLELLLDYPLGFYGSKDAYEIAISQKCTPIINMSNTHNGWLDLALALGIPGLIIFIALYSTYLKIGINATRNRNQNTILEGAGLSAMVIIWLLRGLLDATSRDQMLEIQAFCMALFTGLIIRKKIN